MMKVSLYRHSLLISLYSLEVLVKDMSSVQIHISSMCNNGHLLHGSVLTMVEKKHRFVQIVEYRPP